MSDEPVKIADRMPTKEERERHILWYHEYTEEWFPGDYIHYDGRWIQIGMRHWHIQEPLYEFTHWMFAPDEPLQELILPKKGEEKK